MTLTSIKFLLFFAAVLIMYFLIPKKIQYVYLLVVSLAFYFLSATKWTIVYPFLGVTITYLATNLNKHFHEKADALSDEKQAKRLLLLGKIAIYGSVIINLIFLVLLKYLNLIINTTNKLASLFGVSLGLVNVNWLASLGLSFYTLQLIGYTLDCYWGTITPQKNYLKFALFAAYFPELTSGPIVRYEDVKDQLYAPHRFDYKRVVYGFWRILWGFFKKLVLSESLSLLVTPAYSNPDGYAGFNLWIATFAFCLQLYTDFSGCMDIIMGVSECFGIYLPENFNAPFFSRTIQEFWQRWHITLGGWLRDYIMNPILKSDFAYNLKQFCIKHLGKKRGKKIHVYFAMLILWLAMGIWHGGSWKYALGEGLWFWLLIVLGESFSPLSKKLVEKLHINTECAGWHIFQSIRTFLCFSVGMIFFRADSTTGSIYIIKKAFTSLSTPITIFDAFDTYTIVVVVFGLILLLIMDTFKYKQVSVRDTLAGSHITIRWFCLYAMILLLTLHSIRRIGLETGAFIYGQF